MVARWRSFRSTARRRARPSYGPYYLSTRDPGGWSTEDVDSAAVDRAAGICVTPSDRCSRPDLSEGVLQDGWNWGEGYPRYPDDNGTSITAVMMNRNLCRRRAAGGAEPVFARHRDGVLYACERDRSGLARRRTGCGCAGRVVPGAALKISVMWCSPIRLQFDRGSAPVPPALSTRHGSIVCGRVKTCMSGSVV